MNFAVLIFLLALAVATAPLLKRAPAKLVIVVMVIGLLAASSAAFAGVAGAAVDIYEPNDEGKCALLSTQLSVTADGDLAGKATLAAFKRGASGDCTENWRQQAFTMSVSFVLQKKYTNPDGSGGWSACDFGNGKSNAIAKSVVNTRWVWPTELLCGDGQYRAVAYGTLDKPTDNYGGYARSTAVAVTE